MIVPLEPGHLPALRRFLDGLPEGDVTFIKEDVRDPAVAEAWAGGAGTARRWVDVDDGGAVRALASVNPLTGWSSHVGEVRLVVDPAARGQGVGRALMAASERWVQARGIPKLNLMVRTGNLEVLGFYERLGYAQDDVVVLGRRLGDPPPP